MTLTLDDMLGDRRPVARVCPELELTNYELHVAKALAALRGADTSGGDKNFIGERPLTPDERLAQDVRSALGEIAACRYTNLAWTGIDRRAVDVGGVYEVRTVTERHHNLICRRDDKPLPHILVCVVANIAVLIGWAHADDVRTDRWLHRGSRQGDSHYWQMDQNATQPMSSLAHARDVKWSE